MASHWTANTVLVYYGPWFCSTVLYGSISVTCTREEMRDSFAYRDFTLLHADLPGSK